MNKKRILIVYNNQQILAKYKSLLIDDFDVITSYNPFEALKLIEENNSFAVIISDYKMPNMDGYKLLKQVKKILPDCVRIMFTDKTDYQTVIKAINTGNVFRFLTKPCTDENFILVLKDAIKQHMLLNAEKKLNKERLNLRTFVDTVPCIILWISSDLTYLGVNQRLASIFKMKPEDFPGNSIGFLNEKYDMQFIPFAKKLFSISEEYYNEEISISYKNNENAIFYLFSQKYDHGNKAYIVGLDITKLKEMEKELRKNKKYLSLIIQNMGDGIVVVDPEERITVMNILAMDYMRYTPKNINNLFLRDIFVNCNNNIDELLSIINSEEYSEKLNDLEISRSLPNNEGNKYYKINKTSFNDIDDQLTGKVFLLREVTKEKELERMKNEFISNLSHELRTPMNAIIGISDVLSKKNNENLSDKQLKGLGMINKSGIRLLSLINNLLDISKIEADKVKIIPTEISTIELCNNMQDLAKGLISNNDIKFSLILNESVPNIFISDKEILIQILTNLIGNAVKFTEKGNISLNLTVINDKLYFKVIDTGIGIKKSDLPYIFDRFRQADGSNSRKYHGTGLGLALSQELVILLKGKIWAKSKKDTGTTMSFYIPLILQKT